MGFFKKLFGSSQPAPDLPVHPDDKDLITDYDIKWWKSLTLDDLKAFQEQDRSFQFALYFKLTEEDGMSDYEAHNQVRKKQIYYTIIPFALKNMV